MTLIIFMFKKTSALLFYSLSVESKSAPAILASILSRQQAIRSWNPHCSLSSAFHSSSLSWSPSRAKDKSWNPLALHPSSLLPSDPNSTSDSTSSRFCFLAHAFSDFSRGLQLENGFPRIAQTNFPFLHI